MNNDPDNETAWWLLKKEIKLWIKRLFHRHTWKQYSIKRIGITRSQWAVYYDLFEERQECECGETRRRMLEGDIYVPCKQWRKK